MMLEIPLGIYILAILFWLCVAALVVIFGLDAYVNYIEYKFNEEKRKEKIEMDTIEYLSYHVGEIIKRNSNLGGGIEEPEN